jgi:hypothetical protein
MSIGPIPWTAMATYADRNGFSDPDDFDDFIEVLTALDGAYLDHVQKKMSGNSLTSAR